MEDLKCNKTCPAWDVCLSPGAAEYEGCSRSELRALAESEARLRKAVDEAIVALTLGVIWRRHGAMVVGETECQCPPCRGRRILEAARAGEGK